MKGEWITVIVCVMLAMLDLGGCARTRTHREAQAEAERDITVPVSDEAEEGGQRPQETIIIVEPDGTYVIEGRKHDLEALDEKLRQIAMEHTEQHLVVRGDRDKEAPFEAVVALLDLCKKHDIWNVSFFLRADGAVGGDR